MAVKTNRVCVFCFNDQREGLYVAFESPKGRIGKKRASYPMSLKSLIDGKTTNKRNR